MSPRGVAHCRVVRIRRACDASAAPPAASFADPHAGGAIAMHAGEPPSREVVEQMAREAGLGIEAVERPDAGPSISLSMQAVPAGTLPEPVGAKGDVPLVDDGDTARGGSARLAAGGP